MRRLTKKDQVADDKYISIRIPAKLHKEMKMFAGEKGTYIREIVLQGIKKIMEMNK